MNKKIDINYKAESHKVKVRLVGDDEIFLPIKSSENLIFCDKKNLASAVNAQISRMSGEINEQSGAIILSGNPSELVLFAQIERAQN